MIHYVNMGKKAFHRGLDVRMSARWCLAICARAARSPCGLGTRRRLLREMLGKDEVSEPLKGL